MLEIKLLGVPEVCIDGHAVTFTRRPSVALLAYLVLSGRVHTREALATLLAGDSFEEQARKQLSNVLVDLHQHLGDIIVTNRQTVSFDQTRPYRLDVAEFVAHVARCQQNASLSDLEAAIALYRDDFMAGFTFSDSPDFDAWQDAEREELREEFMQMLRAHVAASLREGAWNRGLRSARRMLAQEPWLEDVHRQLMLMLAHSGQRQAALAQYHSCRRVLREEMGAEPSPETVDLFNRVRAALAPPPNNLPIAPSPLVGRTELIRLLNALLEDPGCRLVTITGLGGSGKTRLALEVARGFVAQGNPPAEQPFPDGVFLVELDGVPTNPTSRAKDVDTAGGLLTRLQKMLEERAHDPIAVVQPQKTRLSERAMLVILDTAEQPGVHASVISRLLDQLPRCKLLVTSRVPLQVPAEHVLHVDGLAVPADEDEIEAAEASALFLHEARRTSLAFRLREEERPALVRLCRLLGGFPLAMLLAARWTPILSCSMLVTELESRNGLDILDTRDRDLPERQRSIKHIVESALIGLPGNGRAAAQLLEEAASIGDLERHVVASDLPRGMATELRALDQQALLHVDDAQGIVELHPLLRQYARHKAPPSAPDRWYPRRDAA